MVRKRRVDVVAGHPCEGGWKAIAGESGIKDAAITRQRVPRRVVDDLVGGLDPAEPDPLPAL